MSKGPPPPPVQAAAGYMDIQCPHCGSRLSIHPSQAGATTNCPRCQGNFCVPLPAARFAGGTFDNPEGEPAEFREFVAKKIPAGICGILLGGLGIHKFILGLNNAGIIMLVTSLLGATIGSCLIVPILAPLVMTIIGLIEGILYFTRSDREFYEAYAVRQQQWF